jgi:hypothetical protein
MATVTLWAVPAGAVQTRVGGTSAPVRGALFGAYVNNKTNGDQYAYLRTFEGKLGRKLAIVSRYHAFTDRWFGYESDVLAGGRIAMISWRATDSGLDPNRAQKIASGQYDGVIRQAAAAMKALKGPVLVRFNWEMDQDPGERQYIGGPSQFIAAWRHVVRIFRDRNANNVQWIWAPRAGSFKKGEGQRYYPGDAWVDWIGGSAVPINNYTSFRNLFGTFYRWAAPHGKPVFIWAGVQEKSGNPQWKASWFDGASSTIRSSMPAVKAFVYYHALAPKGGHYWADTSTASMAAFRRMASLPYFEGNGGAPPPPPPPPNPGPDPKPNPNPPPQPAPQPKPTPTVGPTLFADSFRNGNLSAWNTTGGKLELIPSGEGHVVRALVPKDGGRDKWAKARFRGRTGVVARFRLRIASLRSNVTVLKLLSGRTGTPVVISLAPNRQLIRWTSTTGVRTGRKVTGRGWHHVRVRANMRKGRVTVLLDGNVVPSLSGSVNLSGRIINGVQLGNDTPGRRFNVFLDDVTVRAV